MLFDYGPAEPVTMVISFVVVVICLVMALRIMRFQTRFSRRWESVDKRLSEVLWRARNSDPEEIRKRTAMLEEKLEESMDFFRRVASAMDTQIEALRSETKTSLSKIDRTDSKSAGQNRMVIYQLERLRNQLKKLEQGYSKPLIEEGATRPSSVQPRYQGGPPIPGRGYRMEAVFEPMGAPSVNVDDTGKENDKSKEKVNPLEELFWEDKS